jgi:hypothetical protein
LPWCWNYLTGEEVSYQLAGTRESAYNGVG